MPRTQLSVLNKISHPKELMCCKYSYDRRHILTGGTDGVVRKYESRTTNLEREFVDHDIENDPNPVTAIIINPSRESPHFIATYVKGYVKLWHTKSGECLRTINENRQILNATHHPTSPKFLTMGDDGQLYLYDVETGQRERTFFDSYAPDRVEGHRSRVFAAKFNPKSVNEFISGGWDDTVQFWDIRKSQSCRYLSGAHVCGEGLDIDQKGEQILTSAYQKDNPLQLWDYKTGKLFFNLETEKSKLYCGKWISPMFIATGSSEPTALRIVNMFSYGTVTMYKYPFLGVYYIDSYAIQRKIDKDNTLYARLGVCVSNLLTEFQIEYTYT